MQRKIDITILPEEQQRIFSFLKENEWIREFYLAGGTALALQYKHRESVDFDFFSGKNFTNDQVLPHLKQIGNTEILSEEKNTLHTIINGVQLSFLGYKYKMINTTINEGNIKVADHLDIACMKLAAIVSRGTKKDFIDLFYILHHHSLKYLIEQFHKKYDFQDHTYILLKSLVYFEDAESDPMPVMKEQTDWNEIKKKITKEVKDISL
ncbi:MAG: nucleotidyl transferase AbiEii/AbiGii toxin family protein [Bacteroidota bacterium]